MILRTFSLTFVILISALGCGSGSGRSAPNVPAPVGPVIVQKGVQELQGRWRSVCTQGKLDALTIKVGFGVTQVTEIEVSEDQIIETTFITSGSCEGSDIEIRSSGVYSSAATPRSEVKAIDFVYAGYRVNPLTEFGVRVLKLNKFCGIAEWTIGGVREIAISDKKSCLPKPITRTVFALEGERLYFGLEREAPPALSRATELRRDWYFARQ